MNTLSDYIYLVGGITISFLIISIGFMFYRSQKQAADGALDKVNTMSATIDEDKWLQYDGLEVSGAQLTSIVKKFIGTNTYIEIVYGTGDIRKFGDGQSNTIASLNNREEDNYVRPSAKYIGEVVYKGNQTAADGGDVNSVIEGIRFTPE